MRTTTSSPEAAPALALVTSLQARFVGRLQDVPGSARFGQAEWLRDGGRHGGGARFEASGGAVWNRASVNVSHVHYDDEPGRPLRSATALSSIIHPDHPRAPSIHLHVSFTETRAAPGSWRVMADLNPSLPSDGDRDRFAAAVTGALQAAGDDTVGHALADGDRYFFIPALGRHRGVFHTYLEGYATNDPAADLALARATAEAAIDTYVDIVTDALARAEAPSADDRAAQLAYHTVYLLQVLTLDRGTTSGVLVHDENDAGIMGSLPSFIDRALLASWRPRLPDVQRPLLDAILAALPDVAGAPVAVDPDARLRLAANVRAFYQANPAALDAQARGSVVPPTVHNHVGGASR